MPSTFFGLTISSSALSAFQASVHTTANNISNVKTAGYSRQEAILQSAEAIRVHHRYGTAGTGVEVPAIKQIRDVYYDMKYWESNSKLGLYDTKLYYSQQIEDYLLDDDTLTGFNTILDEMFNALDTLQTAAGDEDKRAQFISKAQNLVSYFAGVSDGFSKIQDSCNEEISTQVENINTIAAKLASLNKEINVVELQGGYANELRDERALLMDELSSMVQVDYTETKIMNSNYPEHYLGGTNYMVKINGQTLVDGDNYYELTCVSREYKINQSDNEGLYDVVWKETNIPLATTSELGSGSLKALFEMRDGNNKQGFEGKITDFELVGNRTVMTLSDASITDIKQMTMDYEGIIMIRNKEYKYNSFSYDAEKNEYTFVLEEKLSKKEQRTMLGKTASIGTSIDAMGVPYYMSQLNTFLRTFCEQFNNLQKTGVDANGNDAGAFFVALNPSDNEIEYGFKDYDANGSMSTYGDTYYRLTAQTVSVAYDIQRNPSLMATVTKEAYNPDDKDKHDLLETMMSLKSDTVMFRGDGADAFLECLISDNSVDTQKAQIFQTNYSNITNTVDTRRMSVSGVDEDEEAMDLLRFQNAYNLASKMVQTLNEMYRRLILETGV